MNYITDDIIKTYQITIKRISSDEDINEETERIITIHTYLSEDNLINLLNENNILGGLYR